MGDIFRVGKISNIFWGVFEIPDIVLGRTEDAGLDPKVGRKNESTPPPLGYKTLRYTSLVPGRLF